MKTKLFSYIYIYKITIYISLPLSSIILNGNALNVSSETINERLKEYYKRQLLEKKRQL